MSALDSGSDHLRLGARRRHLGTLLGGELQGFLQGDHAAVALRQALRLGTCRAGDEDDG